ncbi:TetR/AcrR family transcriptional regulator [Mumia sp. ZJ430]|uniref:TetR/AcrR family transcriptional regulator n=1 Tax=Mumia sp. ZJ430 TaxID=2708083 RepID=UPI00141F2E85|nr:TetR/AcrR family transcriptional regulator [Mumia sp. ZJ430]
MNRADIVDIASQMVAEGGWKALTVRAVAARAEIAVGTLRHYFATQAELFSAVGRRLNPVDFGLADVDPSLVSADAKLLAVLRQILPPVSTERDAIIGWFLTHAEAYGPQAWVEMEDLLVERSMWLRVDVEKTLNAIEREGGRRTERDVKHQATLLIAVISGLRALLLTDEAVWDDDAVHVLKDVVRSLIVA